MPSIHLSALRFNFVCMSMCAAGKKGEAKKKSTKRQAATYANGFCFFYELYWSIFRGRKGSVWVLARPFRHVFSVHKLMAATVHSKWTNKCMEVKSTFAIESNCHPHINFRFPIFFFRYRFCCEKESVCAVRTKLQAFHAHPVETDLIECVFCCPTHSTIPL